MSEPNDQDDLSGLAGSMRPRDAEQRGRQLRRYKMEWPASLKDEFAFRDAEREELVSLLHQSLEWLWGEFSFRSFPVSKTPDPKFPLEELPGLLELQAAGWDTLGEDFFDFALERWNEEPLDERGHWPTETPAAIEFWRQRMRRASETS